MPRTIAAVYDTRAEAELARSRLVSEVQARSPRIITRETAGAVESLRMPRTDVEAYRSALRRGSHLLVAQVPSGTNAERIIELLEQSAGEKVKDPSKVPWEEVQQGFQVEDSPETVNAPTAAPPEPLGSKEELQGAVAAPSPEPQENTETLLDSPALASASAIVSEEARVPIVHEELRIGKRQVASGGVRVRSLTRETPAEDEVTLRDEVVHVESCPSERHMTDEEVEAGGLFKERVFEIAEMREEPVVTKVAVVREEVIVRKTFNERTETIRETLRHTEVEVEDLPPLEEATASS